MLPCPPRRIKVAFTRDKVIWRDILLLALSTVVATAASLFTGHHMALVSARPVFIMIPS